MILQFPVDSQLLDSKTDLRDLERRGTCYLSRESNPASLKFSTLI